MNSLGPRSLESLRDSLRSRLPGRALLWTLSLLYLAAVSLRRYLYARGLLASASLPARVVCFGNISAGGTGKTSTVIAAAQGLKKAGFSPAILMRGYGRPRGARGLVLLSGDGDYDAAECGDEAVIVHNALRKQSVPVAVSPDRLAAGRAAVQRLGCDVLLMDDGYQHFRLRRDKDIAIVSAAAPFYRDSLLPLGNLRESPSGLARASLVIISHCERASTEQMEELRVEIRRVNPRAAIAESRHSPEHFIDARERRPLPLSTVKKRTVSVISAIGDPESFERSLRGLGARLEGIWRYPDHHRFTVENIRALAIQSAGRPVVTTYKDFSRFPPGWEGQLTGPLYILSVRIEFLRDGWDLLMEQLLPAKAAP